MTPTNRSDVAVLGLGPVLVGSVPATLDDSGGASVPERGNTPQDATLAAVLAACFLFLGHTPTETRRPSPSKCAGRAGRTRSGVTLR